MHGWLRGGTKSCDSVYMRQACGGTCANRSPEKQHPAELPPRPQMSQRAVATTWTVRAFNLMTLWGGGREESQRCYDKIMALPQVRRQAAFLRLKQNCNLTSNDSGRAVSSVLVGEAKHLAKSVIENAAQAPRPEGWDWREQAHRPIVLTSKREREGLPMDNLDMW